MDYQQMIDQLSPELYRRLLSSLELGKWPDGSPMTGEQREHTMRAVIAWGEAHLPEEERVGYIDRGKKAGETCDDPVETPLKWRE